LLVCCLGLEDKVQVRNFYHLCIDIKQLQCIKHISYLAAMGSGSHQIFPRALLFWDVT